MSLCLVYVTLLFLLNYYASNKALYPSWLSGYHIIDNVTLQCRVYNNCFSLNSDRGILHSSFASWIISVIILILDIVDKSDYSSLKELDQTSPSPLNPFPLKLKLVNCLLNDILQPVAAGSGIPEIKCYLNGIKVSMVHIKPYLKNIILTWVACGLY